MQLLCKVVLLCIISLYTAFGQRTADKMFIKISGSSCFRKFNATHTTGCSSTFRGSVGVLHVVKEQSDMDFFNENIPSPPYAPVLPPHLFTRDNMLKLKDLGTHLVSAVVLINDFTKVTTFSHESKCPNQYSGYNRDGTCSKEWNPPGTNLLHEDFPFPIYFVNDQDEIEKILDCFEKFNNFDLENQNERSLCSIQVNSLMSGAVNSEVCLRRTNLNSYFHMVTYCDPLQGQNVYATLFPREIVEESNRTPDPKERFIFVTARMDTTSMFDGIGVGAMGSLVSFATLMSTANVLSRILPQKQGNQRNVVFVLFNGESYDYIGSQRLVYDMSRKEFPYRTQRTRPIQMSQIDLLIDIGVLDDINNPVFYNLRPDQLDLINFSEIFKKYNSVYDLFINSTAKSTSDIPPTSANSFLYENKTLPVVIMNSDPKNRFLHSIYDTDLNIKFDYKNKSKDYLMLWNMRDTSDFNATDIQMGIRNLSTVLAFSLYELVTSKPYNNAVEGANPYLIDEFLYCWLFSAKCNLLYSAVTNNATLFPHYPPRYISIDRSHSILSTIWVYDLMGLLIGQKVDSDFESCKGSTLHWYPGFNFTGLCVQTTQNYSAALSPAFRIPDYDWSSGRYSTWTESTWSSMSARIFLSPSAYHEAFTLTLGLVVMIVSFILVALINNKSDMLFGNCPSSSEAITAQPAC